MKVDANVGGIQHEGTLGSEGRVAMEFDQNALTHLMSVLTDLYSDPLAAVIREYSTNAWDSHQAAGISDPIEIELPYDMNPVFVVRDHGVGMSEDEIINQFSKYGFSSKRDTDDQVGMLGLGCKSALTYTSQFTLVAVKNGIQTIVLVTRDESGTGAVQIIDTTETDAQNGVEVRIPVKDTYTFNARAEKFYRFWPKGSVLIDGDEPKVIGTFEGDLSIDPDVILTTHVERDTIVMGNVAYPLNYQYHISNSDAMRAVIRVPIGSVNFTPSREALHYTEKTKDTIETAKQFIRRCLEHVARTEIEAAPDKPAAMEIAQRWRRVDPRAAFSYRTEVIPTSFRPADRTLYWDIGKFKRSTNPARRVKFYIKIEDAQKALHVLGHKAGQMAPGFKLRLIKYMEENNLDFHRIYVYKYDVLDGWIDEDNVISAEDVRAIQLDTGPTAPRTRPKMRLLGRWGEAHDVEADDLPKNTQLVVMPMGDSRHYRERVSEFWEAYHKDKVSIVLVAKGREEKFFSMHPKAITIDDWVNSLLPAIIAKMSDYDRYLCNGGSQDFLARVRALKNPADPLFHRLRDATAKVSPNIVNEWRTLGGICHLYGDPWNPEKSLGDGHKNIVKLVNEVQKKYPVLGLQSYYLRTVDVEEIINALYFYKASRELPPQYQSLKHLKQGAS